MFYFFCFVSHSKNLMSPDILGQILSKLNKETPDSLIVDHHFIKEIAEKDVMSYEDYSSIIRLINELIDVKDKNLSETLIMLNDLILYNLTEKIKNDTLNKLEKEFKQLKLGGSSQSVEANIQIGYGLEATTIKTTITGGCNIYTSDDKKVNEGCKISLMLSASVGLNLIAKAQGLIEGTFTKTRMFLSVRQWLETNLEENLSSIIPAITGKRALLTGKSRY